MSTTVRRSGLFPLASSPTSGRAGLVDYLYSTIFVLCPVALVCALAATCAASFDRYR
ncbi:hypothetical protein [Embleya sp. NPDC001921]